ncbi:MAG: diguanylate cyclase [Methylomarinum sp.]|nr:diguanylate cyclase [Methylomarinum sp.]
MSIFSKQNNPDKWKDKYFDLLDENEEKLKSQLDNEVLLCKTIVRLSLATTGFNKDLDPYLLAIRNQLKSGLKSDQLKIELEKFSNALMTLEENALEETKLDATLLFEFLFYHFPDHKKDFQLIEAKFEKNEYPNSQYLFVAIIDQIDGIQHLEPTLKDLPIDADAINTQLLALLEGTEVPAKFQSQAKDLKDRLYSNLSITTALDETVSLLFQIKKHFQSEHQEMAAFLTQLTDQLTELGGKVSGTNSTSKSSAKKRNQLDQSVSSQMLDLQQTSEDATQLEPLKKIIHSRLADIAQQIHNHRTGEELERNQIHHELESLTLKINEMEQESKQLKVKLSAAHKTSLHDPLTGLPNRLAYDERFATELARSKRYNTPLSILIWDIDLLKHINDTFGHKAGDKTLILISKLLSNHCRETDFVSRFGGEEFTMLLSDTDVQSALLAADKLRNVIEKTAFNSNGKKISITISCGITQFTKDDTGESAFNRADKALYEAKNNGRNQCVVN